MSKLSTRLKKLEAHSPSNIPIVRMKKFDGTRENVKRQIAEESAAAEAAGERLIAISLVPYIGESMNDCRKELGFAPFSFPSSDEPRK